jgi:DNA-binding transcriptional ArsR family regulator
MLQWEKNTTIAAEAFKILGDNTRLKILLVCGEGEVSVNEIAEKIKASPSLVSHNLRLLKAHRLIKSRHKDRHVFYEADDEHIRQIIKNMLEHMDEGR